MRTMAAGSARRLAAVGMACAMLACARPACAVPPAVRLIASLFGAGGYFFTSSSARTTLGNPKWYGNTQLFVKPKHYGRYTFTGGVEIVSAGDHFLPFQGGNAFSLTGGAFRIRQQRGVLRPWIGGGLYAGRARSVNYHFDTTIVTPAGAVGVDWHVHRYITLTAAFHASETIHGVNTNGFSLSLSFF